MVIVKGCEFEEDGDYMKKTISGGARQAKRSLDMYGTWYNTFMGISCIE